MTNVLLPARRSAVVRGVPVRASVVGVSAELASHHLGVHGCPATGHYDVTPYECLHDGVFVRVVECGVCGEPLVAIAPVVCEHLPELLDELASGALR